MVILLSLLTWYKPHNPYSLLFKQLNFNFSTVRYPLLKGSLFTECVDTLKALNLYNWCKSYIDNAALHHNDPFLVHKSIAETCLTARRRKHFLFASGGFTGKEHSTNRYGSLI